MKLIGIAFDGLNATTKLQKFTLSHSVMNCQNTFWITISMREGKYWYRFRFPKRPKFSTPDQDNDKQHFDNCATLFKGGWWFNDCITIYFNGKYSSIKSVTQVFRHIH